MLHAFPSRVRSQIDAIASQTDRLLFYSYCLSRSSLTSSHHLRSRSEALA